MPTYEYLCGQCKHRFEIVQKITADSLTECPECGGRIRRVLFPVGIVYKGTGFYTTDYGKTANERREAVKKESSNGKESESPAKSDSDTSSGTTPAKTDAKEKATTRAD